MQLNQTVSKIMATFVNHIVIFMEDFSKYNGDGTSLRAAQMIMVNMLMNFDEVCKKNNLTYWIDFGSLLGAVRHKGFIPWDDDIDVSMPTKDFYKFIEIGQKDLSNNYFLQTEKNDKGSYMEGGVFKIRDLNSLLINTFDDFQKDYKKGISIDVFESVAFPTVPKPVFKFFHRRICKAYGFFHYNQSMTFMNIIRYFVFPISYVFFMGLWKMICFVKKNDRELTPINRVIYGYPTLRTEIFPLSKIEFEGHDFFAPGNPDRRLSDMYGDYMSIPPAEKRRIHAKFICTDLKSVK